MRKKSFLVTLLVAALLCTMLAGNLTMDVAADTSITHTVKYGETLSWISWMYGVTIQEMVDANDLANRHLIYAGQELTIPGTSEEDYVEHVVQSGETLLTIAAKYDVSIWDIARRNGIWNINLIFVGDTLIIPGGGEGTPEAPDTPPDVQEVIIITAPTMNQEITSPVTVTGWGSGFENNLAVDVLDQTGSTIGQGNVTVDAEFGQIGPFTGTITFDPPASEGLGRVAVYSISPRDGAIEHLASVTVNLKP
ncbi:MAG: LysM peptidoglycan-binding domain-containing protein [Chloroflexota bacterium]|nr:LysM peptidoglycan-binding domain-containing protein [Chloroflexota bacterium]